MRRSALVLVAGLVVVSPSARSQTQSQSPRAVSHFGHGPDSIPDLTNRFVVVYGLQPLNDSATAVLRRRGYRVADRSPGTLERARVEKRRLDPAHYAILVEVRYDSLARGQILVARLLDIETTSRLRGTSVLLPRTGRWGGAMDTVLTQLLAPPIRR